MITGADSQILTMALNPGDVLKGSPGSMMFMSDNVKADANLTCSISRVCVGESCFEVDFENTSNSQGYVGVTPSFPAKIVPIDLNTVGGSLIAKGGAYFSHIGNVNVDISCDFSCLRCCCGGAGMTRQKLNGDGTAFLEAGGTIIQKQLAEGETVVVDTESVVAWAETVEMGLRTAGGCCMCCCGGEGLFNTTMTGPGLLVMQSMSFEKYVRALVPPQPRNDTPSIGDVA
jgi:uncharacterized protein (AIM24 family)